MKIQTRFFGIPIRSTPLPLGTTVASEDTVKRDGLAIWRRREAEVIAPNVAEVRQYPPLDADLTARHIRYRLDGEAILDAGFVLSRFMGLSSVLVPDAALPRRARR
ncbi:MAG: hypothetical protein HY344_04535 [Candidatus Levybacteria bacterium]|nr:hypothetical protein [Candidatus Levybacteria bacterium]